MQRRTALDPTIKPFGASVRSLPRLFAVTAILVGVLGLAGTAKADQTSPGVVDVILVNGYIDPVVAQFVDDAITDAERTGASALVLQLDSPGVVVSGARFDRLRDHVAGARGTTVTVWVGPSGAQAAGRSAELALAAKHAGLAPGSKLEVNGQRLSADEAF